MNDGRPPLGCVWIGAFQNNSDLGGGGQMRMQERRGWENAGKAGWRRAEKDTLERRQGRGGRRVGRGGQKGGRKGEKKEKGRKVEEEGREKFCRRTERNRKEKSRNERNREKEREKNETGEDNEGNFDKRRRREGNRRATKKKG